ncbi:MAG: hypothetical protein ACI81P_003058, partial [Neolewinella sp.]
LILPSPILKIISVTEAMQRICKFGENKSVRSKTSKLFIRRP